MIVSFLLISARGTLAGRLVPIKLINFYEVLPSPYAEIIRSAEGGVGNLSNERVDSTLAYFDSQLLEPDLEDRLRVCILVTYAQILLKQERLNEAYSYCKGANDLALSALASNDLIRGYAHAAYGSYLNFYNAPELAIIPLRQAIPALNKLNQDGILRDGGTVWQLIRNEVGLGFMEEARARYEERVLIQDSLGTTLEQLRTHNHFGICLQKAGHHQEAISVFDRGLALLQNSSVDNERFRHVNVLESRAHSLIVNGRFEDAMQDLKFVYYTRKELDRYGSAMQAMNYIISYLMGQDRHREAYRFFIAEQSYFRMDERLTRKTNELFLHLGELHAALGLETDSQAFYHIYNDYAANEIVPRLEASLQPPGELSAQVYLQNRAAEQEIMIGQLERNQLRQELKVRQYGIIALCLLALLMVFAGWVLRWRNRWEQMERKRAEADQRRILELENENLKFHLTSQKKDIKRLAVDNRLRTEMKQDILQQIEKIYSKPPEQCRIDLGRLKKELSAAIAEQDAISDLQEQVDAISAAFVERLRERIPGITPQEIHYCSLIRTGMNNQQLAQSLNKSQSTIRSYKHRISKKAGVQQKDGLIKLIEAL